MIRRTGPSDRARWSVGGWVRSCVCRHRGPVEVSGAPAMCSCVVWGPGSSTLINGRMPSCSSWIFMA